MATKKKNDESILNEYLRLQSEIEKIEKRIDEIKPVILKSILSTKEKEIISEGHKFMAIERMKWTYSKEVTELEAKMKAQKTLEETNGTAKLSLQSQYFKVTKVQE